MKIRPIQALPKSAFKPLPICLALSCLALLVGACAMHGTLDPDTPYPAPIRDGRINAPIKASQTNTGHTDTANHHAQVHYTNTHDTNIHDANTHANQINNTYIANGGYVDDIYPSKTIPNTATPSTITANTAMPSTTTATTPTVANVQFASFDEWRDDFVARNPQLNAILANAYFDRKLVALDNNQAEFAKAPWEYLDDAVLPSRVQSVRAKMREHSALFANIHAVDPAVVAAIWARESAFGANMGNTELPKALATLAYDGRRRTMFENELVALGALVARGDVPMNIKGSWAGGMGHTQFMPATWQRFGVDGDQDGRIDPRTLADALASTANYLAQSGFDEKIAPFYEVRLPSGFDSALVGQKMPVHAWRALVSFIDSPPQNAELTLLLPAGKDGPALLTSKSFDAIYTYNKSINYVLAVAMLAKKVNGGNGFVVDFPRHQQMPSRQDIMHAQQKLTAMGFDTQGVDGVAGENTRRAFANYQRSQGQFGDGFMTQKSIAPLLY